MQDVGGKRLTNRPFVIGEIGCSHEGRLEHAKTLIGVAARTKCDAVKIQYYEPERLIARRQAAPLIDVYKKYRVPSEWLEPLAEAARAQGIEFVISVYDAAGAEIAAPYADLLKVSSFECTDLHLIEALERYAKPIIVSTGMTSPDELHALVLMRDMLHVPVYLLHCVSSYPVAVGSMQLRLIRECGLDGLSDHSGVVDMAGWAVAAGAALLEVHMSPLHRELSQGNPDWPYSLDERALKRYVEQARVARASLGSGEPGQRPIIPAEDACRPFRVQLEEA